jgi:hypothetical protein
MKSQKEAEYLERFKTFTPEQKRQHFAFALRFLITLMREKEGIGSVPALDVDVVDGEYTVGGEA